MKISHRYNWIDYVKGLTIIMVVNMHSYYSYTKYIQDAAFIGYFVEWAQLFRMPLFFLIAGLFAYKSLSLKLVDFLDKKILHFAYFYILWLFVFTIIRSQGNIQNGLEYFIFNLTNASSTLWFIYILALFFAVFRLLKNVNALLVLTVAVALHVTHIKTGNDLLDEFAYRWVYFLISAHFSGFVLKNIQSSKIKLWQSIVLLCAYILISALAFQFNLVITHNHLSSVNLNDFVFGLVTFILGGIGAWVVLLIAKNLSDNNLLGFLKICGQKSLQIYLAFFIFMLPMRLATGLIVSKLGIAQLYFFNDFLILSITIFAVFGPVYLDYLIKNIKFFMPLQFIFQRPAWINLTRLTQNPTKLVDKTV